MAKWGRNIATDKVNPREESAIPLWEKMRDNSQIIRDFWVLTRDLGLTQGQVANQIVRLTGRNLQKDVSGNWYLHIPCPDGSRSTTVFCAHVDTVSRLKRRDPSGSEDPGTGEKVYHRFVALTKPDRDLIMTSDGEDILGADDLAGVALLCHMMREAVPGLYYFFRDEESGRQGSEGAAKAQDIIKPDKYRRCIAFDRFGYTSIISHQSGKRTCSKKFVDSLSDAFFQAGMGDFEGDEGGSYTDSYSFRGIIPECTNISIGYWLQHRNSEEQNLTFLDEMAKAVLLIDWEGLPTDRDPTKPEYNRYSYNAPRNSLKPGYYESFDGWKRRDFIVNRPDWSAYQQWLAETIQTWALDEVVRQAGTYHPKEFAALLCDWKNSLYTVRYKLVEILVDGLGDPYSELDEVDESQYELIETVEDEK